MRESRGKIAKLRGACFDRLPFLPGTLQKLEQFFAASPARLHAIGSLADSWPEHWRYAAVGYGVGALWILVVFISHWHSCTTTKG